MRTVLVALGIAAALVASGSATVTQARAAGMDTIPAVALVVLLEVVNVAGTWTWMVDGRTHVQWEAGAGVGVASLVTGACGAVSYGPIGVVPAVGVLFTVHLVGRLSHRSTTTDQPSTTTDQPSTTTDQPSTTIDHEPVEPSPSVDERVDEPCWHATVDTRSALDRLRAAAAAISWPEPGRQGFETMTVAGYRGPDAPFEEPCPTGPLDRADDGRPLDVIEDEPTPAEEPDDSWRDHAPTEAEYAAVLLDHPDRAGKRITERPLADALVALGFPEKGSRYRAKKYLGNATVRLEAAG